MRQWGVNNLPKVVAQQRHGRGSNPRPLDRKSHAIPLSHRATPRSLKMAPFSRPYTTSYWSAIVNIALSGTVFELFDIE